MDWCPAKLMVCVEHGRALLDFYPLSTPPYADPVLTWVPRPCGGVLRECHILMSWLPLRALIVYMGHPDGLWQWLSRWCSVCNIDHVNLTLSYAINPTMYDFDGACSFDFIAKTYWKTHNFCQVCSQAFRVFMAHTSMHQQQCRKCQNHRAFHNSRSP